MSSSSIPAGECSELDAANWFLSQSGWLSIIRPLFEGLTSMYRVKLTEYLKQNCLVTPTLFFVGVDYLVDRNLEKAHLLEDQPFPTMEPNYERSGDCVYRIAPVMFKEATELL